MQDNNIIQEAIDCLKRLHKENAELKVENERLKEELATYGATGVCEVCSDKANKLADKYLGCLQEIKKIAEMDICSNCNTQKREDNCQCLADTILQLITKAECEIKNDIKEPKTYNGYLQDEMQNKYYKGR